MRLCFPLEPCGLSTEKIIDFAENISDALKLEPGMDLEPVVYELNGKIKYVSISRKSSSYASITVKSNRKFIIRLRSFIFPLECRFAIAHELGHFFLHSNFGEIPIEVIHNSQLPTACASH